MLCIVLLAIGCGARTPNDQHGHPGLDGETLAQHARAAHRQADNLVCKVVVAARDGDGERLPGFSVHTWADDQGRVRVRATKVDVDFLDGLLHPDGRFSLALVRDEEVVEGQLADLAAEDGAGAGFFARLDLLVAEVKEGPIPRADTYSAEVGPDGTILLRCRHGQETESVVAIDGRHYQAQHKTLYEHGEAVLRIDYDRYELIDGLRRPLRGTIAFPQSGAMVRVRIPNLGLDEVPGFRPGTFTFEPPADWPRISLETFVERLTATE